MHFGQRVRDRRKELGWTQVALAKKAGISNGFLSDLESGKRKNVGAVALLNISRVLQVSLDYLMTGAGSKRRSKSAATDVEIPAALVQFAAEAGVSFRDALVLLEIQRVILAHNASGKRKTARELVRRTVFP